MARRFRNFRANMVRSGRKTFWLGGLFVEQNLASANSAAILTNLNAAALALRPFTIIRTRGIWGVFSDQIAADESQVVAYGSIIVSDEALAVGVSAVPTPVEQDSSAWIHFSQTIQRFQQSSGVGTKPNMIPWNTIVDSKAMRKVEEGQTLIEVIQNSPNSEGTEVTTYSKVLIKLH